MFWTTKVFSWARTLIAAMLSALSARPGAALLATPTIRLFTGNGMPGPDNVIGDFPAATFTGYTEQTITPSSPVQLTPAGMAVLGNALFTSGSPFTTPGEPVTGYVLYDGATAIYGAERFDTPVSFSAAGQFIDLSVALPLPLEQDTAFGL